jgi:hypothetical protein
MVTIGNDARLLASGAAANVARSRELVAGAATGPALGAGRGPGY